MLNGNDLVKLQPFLDGVVSMNVNLLKRRGEEIKEVLLEFSDGTTKVGNLNQEPLQFHEYNQLRSIERSVARGKYGKWNYQGNCGYRLPQKFIQYVKGKLGEILLADGMEGSGTIRELARDMGIAYWGNDLRYGFDFINDEMPVFPNAIWLHPPYFVGKTKTGLSRMPQYSGVQWGAAAHPSDGSHLHNWDDYIKWLNTVQATAYRNLRNGGYLGLLVGSSRVEGRLYDPYNAMDVYGELDSVIVKEQFNCMSDSVKYANQSFVPIVHEYLFIIRKTDHFIIPCRVARKVDVNLLDGKKTTWKELIANALDSLGGSATTKQILELVSQSAKAKGNNHVSEKIRQVLNTFTDIFEKVGQGVYALKSLNGQLSMAV